MSDIAETEYKVLYNRPGLEAQIIAEREQKRKQIVWHTAEAQRTATDAEITREIKDHPDRGWNTTELVRRVEAAVALRDRHIAVAEWLQYQLDYPEDAEEVAWLEGTLENPE